MVKPLKKGELEAIEMELPQLNELIRERKDPEAGRAIAERLLEKLRAHGRRSAYLSWLLAIACDYTSRLVEAADHISIAVADDPLEPSYQSSRRIIFAKLRGALLAADSNDPASQVGELYARLSRHGEADVDSHLQMVHWLAAQQRWAELWPLIQAVVRLHPASAEAWQMLCFYATARGDREQVDAAAAKVAELRAGEAATTSAPPGPGVS